VRFLKLHSIFKRTAADGLVLCRPRGGLNDMLCQIEKCWSYAEHYGRHLLVDTYRTEFHDDFGKYFVPKAAGRVSFGAFDALRWNGSVRPKFLAGRVNQYEATWSPKAQAHVDRQAKKKPVTFDFSRNHNEQVLVHDQCGGGTLSILALQRLRLASTAVEAIAPRLQRFRNHTAVHVRNTDIRTDYVSLFQEVAASLPEGLIVLCTDDWHCQVYARELFGERVFLSSDIPDTDGRPLHWNRGQDPGLTNLDAITDLLAMALSKQLFVSKRASGQVSGYFRLAQALRERPDIVDGLLGRTT